MSGTAWRSRFYEENDLFASIRDVAMRFANDEAFPTPERIDEVLRDRAPVRFVRAKQDDKELYDARIVKAGEVSTRAGSWHDFLNALVWATFPKAKAALHQRQHRIVVPGAPRRTPEGDALAMLDEGGALLTGPGVGPVIFGHAIFESLVVRRPLFAAGLDVGGPDDLDERAAARISDPALIRTTKDLARVDLPSP